MIEAPAPATDAEQQIDDCADGQQQIADKEILAILHAACADELQVAPDIKAENAGHTEQQNGDTADDRSLFAADAEGIHCKSQQIFKHRQYGGKAGKGHKQEEQGAPQTTALHVDKNAGEGLKDEGGAGIGLDAVGEARRKDDDTGHDRHKGIQDADTGGFARKGMLTAHVAAEDLHCGDAEAEGKERLIHGGGNGIAQTVCTNALGRWQQIELHALGGARQQQAVDGKHQNERQQRQHHHLGDALQPFLHAEAADQKACHNNDDHENRHLARGGKHLIEYPADGFAAHAGGKAADKEFIEVIHHPTGNGGVVHHQKAAAQHTEPAVDMPLLSRLFQRFVCLNGTFPAGAPHGKLHRHDRNTHDDKADEIEQNEVPAAVLTGDIGEAPDIADADGAAGADQ